jgi:hypothetical protein
LKKEDDEEKSKQERSKKKRRRDEGACAREKTVRGWPNLTNGEKTGERSFVYAGVLVKSTKANGKRK